MTDKRRANAQAGARGSLSGRSGSSRQPGSSGQPVSSVRSAPAGRQVPSKQPTTGSLRKVRLSEAARSHKPGAGYTGVMRPVGDHVAHRLRSANPIGHSIQPRTVRRVINTSAIIPTGPVPSQRTNVKPRILGHLGDEMAPGTVLGGYVDADASTMKNKKQTSESGETQMWMALAQSQGVDVQALQRSASMRQDAARAKRRGTRAVAASDPLALALAQAEAEGLEPLSFDEVLAARSGAPESGGQRVSAEDFKQHRAIEDVSAPASGSASTQDPTRQPESVSEPALTRASEPESEGDQAPYSRTAYNPYSRVLVEASLKERDRLRAQADSSGVGGAANHAGAPASRASAGSSTNHDTARDQSAKPAAGGSADLGSTIGSSAALMSLFTVISRVTGFIRTWAMGFAMGTTLLSSSYQVACNLPNQLYELVMGGMLVTAFLPVYVGLRKREGRERANQYASTLMGIVVLILGAAALLGTIFAPQVVYTQMFLNSSGDRELVTYFFRFFSVQLLLYGVGAVLSGILNAERDYAWSSAAPIANNVVVIAAMVTYVFVAPSNPDLAVRVIAIGTPLGVLTQVMVLVPPLLRSGVRLRPRIDIHDPALRETLSLGLATIVVTVCSFVTVSVQNSAAMAVSESGSSILFYSRQWFTLPYAFLAVPISTALFTELSDMAADGDRHGMLRSIVGGTQQSMFFMIPFALYLMVFSMPLVGLFRVGRFTQESVAMVASYLSWMAVSLPFYAPFMFMQKVFSALRRMRFYAAVNVVASLVQVVLTLTLALGFAGWGGMGVEGVAVAQTAFFLIGDVGCFLYLRREFGRIEGIALARSVLSSLLIGAAGALVGAALLVGTGVVLGPAGTSIGRTLLSLVICGIPALLVTYGLAVVLHVPEAAFLTGIARKLTRRR